MLVHKKTLGVLQWYWDGASYLTFRGAALPKMAPVTLETYELNPEDWWQVPNGTPLARKIARCYPFFDPVVSGGELVNIKVWPAWRRYGEEAPPPARTSAAVRRRKYNRRRKPDPVDIGGPEEKRLLVGGTSGQSAASLLR